MFFKYSLNLSQIFAVCKHCFWGWCEYESMCTELRPIRSNYMGGQVYFSLPYSTPPLIDNKSGQGGGGRSR